MFERTVTLPVWLVLIGIGLYLMTLGLLFTAGPKAKGEQDEEPGPW